MRHLYHSFLPIILFALPFGLLTEEKNSLPDNPETDIVGAWERSWKDQDGKNVTAVTIVTDGYFSTAMYDVPSQVFSGTYGGAWSISGDQMNFTIEYDTTDPASVGSKITETFVLTKETLTFDGEQKWTRIDHGTPGSLAGAWLITGRQRNGEMSNWTPGARKTMKILSGTRFQWIAYNTDTGEFFGTGGGTYKTKDGGYTENIEFFSRDGSRVGASLSFEFTFDMEKGQWHHSGFSSKGDPMYEVWTLRSML